MSNGEQSELEAFHAAVGSQPTMLDVVNTSSPTPKITDQSANNDPSTAWAVRGGVIYNGISQSLEKLPPGCYVPEMTDVGVILRKQQLHTDALIDLPDSKSRAVIEEIKHFQQLRQPFKERGLLFKRGVLLWGPPGSGKTSTLHLLMKLIIEDAGGIALMIGNPDIADSALQLIRRIEPHRQIIAIMEDLDGLVHNYSVSGYLSMLDGESQIDNVVFVATTNYPERLDKRFVDRPSRFDTVEYVGMPSDEARECYLRHKEPALPDETIAAMVKGSDGMSIAHLRELIILTQCFGRSLEYAVERLTASRKRKLSSDKVPGTPPPGFGSSQTFVVRRANPAAAQSNGRWQYTPPTTRESQR